MLISMSFLLCYDRFPASFLCYVLTAMSCCLLEMTVITVITVMSHVLYLNLTKVAPATSSRTFHRTHNVSNDATKY